MHSCCRQLVGSPVFFDYSLAAQNVETGFSYYQGYLTLKNTYDTQGLESKKTIEDFMEIVGYRRTSTDQQNLDRQDFPCDRMFEEAASAGTRDRPALNAMIDYVREKDEIRVWSIDRLCRDLRDLQDVIQTVNAKGVSITFLSENLTFTANQNDPFAKLQLQMMGAFAEFERSIIRKRQAEGIAKAKAKGNIYKGRKPTIDVTEIKRLKDQGLGATAIAKKLNIARASVYRVMQSAL